MTPIKIGDLTFDDITYDHVGDVLYLSIGPPAAAADSDETPEGHVLRFDAAGQIIGITLISARQLLERDGHLRITLHQDLTADVLAPALA